MKILKIIGVILLLVGIIWVQRKFYPEVLTVTKTKTIFSVHDSIIRVPSLLPYEVKEPPDTVPIPIDSAAIVAKYLAMHKDYYTKRYYSKEVNVDTIGTFNVKYRVFMNRSDSLQISYNLKPAQIINTTTIANVKNSLYIGGVYSNGITPSVLFDNKGRGVYTLGYNLNTNSVMFGAYININKIRK